jgi:hypothetical protein
MHQFSKAKTAAAHVWNIRASEIQICFGFGPSNLVIVTRPFHLVDPGREYRRRTNRRWQEKRHARRKKKKRHPCQTRPVRGHLHPGRANQADDAIDFFLPGMRGEPKLMGSAIVRGSTFRHGCAER